MSNDQSKARKETPVFRGALMYFPDAIAAVARLSFKANEKHNPGEPMHWSKGKSNDHADCIIRHLMDTGTIDEEFDELHDVAVAWRALANLQTVIENMEVGEPAAATDAKPEYETVPWQSVACHAEGVERQFVILKPEAMGLHIKKGTIVIARKLDYYSNEWRVYGGGLDFRFGTNDMATKAILPLL